MNDNLEYARLQITYLQGMIQYDLAELNVALHKKNKKEVQNRLRIISSRNEQIDKIMSLFPSKATKWEYKTLSDGFGSLTDLVKSLERHINDGSGWEQVGNFVVNPQKDIMVVIKRPIKE